MDIISAIILGLVQGLTEFLPVSSSGHLVLSQHLLGFREPQLAFDLLLHLGTLGAVLIYFRKDIIAIFLSLFGKGDSETGRRWIIMIVIGTIPTVIIGFSFKDYFEALFGEPHIVAVMLWITGILLILSDRVKKASQSDRELTAGRSILVGIAQGLAIIPGISRSGSTISVGIFTGISPEKAARFSFLLSIPAIMGATVLEVGEIGTVAAGDLTAYAVGTIVAFISGYLAIDILLKMVVKRRLWQFSVYLFVVGLVGIILL